MVLKQLLLFLCSGAFAFYTTKAQPSLKVVNTAAAYLSAVKADPTLQMVELGRLIPHLKFDFKYATKDNFTGTRLYPSSTHTTFLRKEPAYALLEVAKELEVKGLGIWIWDAYRPYHVTEKFWELIKDERYVAHPAKGSGHNRGIAIDMTLYDLKTGIKLEMPTGFDDFSEKAHHGYEHLSSTQLQNRELLRTIMEKHGFQQFQTEWWHYYWPHPEQYDVLDFRFNQLKKMISEPHQ